ncbi:growth arrest and DNA damage-inducible protein GADD45 gamma-like [Pelmatolapia mariae]|uniref:growth arrest and DNA damage-inducible protein GADD45 gamma-like n=1 Tax=Pelmatolapia mariae TaxID=158779 RepID=UPI002FE5D50E
MTEQWMMKMVGQALEELLVEAYHQNCLRIGVIESYKYMKANPHRVVLCVLASEKETEGDIMLQINLIQLKDMCYKKNVSIMCSTDMRRLAELVNVDDISGNEASRDLHCILVTVPPVKPLPRQALQILSSFCEESRRRDSSVHCLSCYYVCSYRYPSRSCCCCCRCCK